MSGPRTAVVTGASRGIGRAVAIALAAHGFDVAITARTVSEPSPGEAPAPGATDPLPGSLEATASKIEALGRKAVPLPFDLLDRDAARPTAQAAVTALGHVDVLVNNAIFVGPGNLTRFLDTPWEAVEQRLYANLTAQLAFTRPILASMVERGRGTILTVTSGASYNTPPAPPGEGGWGLAYGASKAGVNRIAVHLAVEYGEAGIRAFSLQPGFVLTERVAASGKDLEFVARRGISPELVGKAVAHVVDHTDSFPNGSIIEVADLLPTLGVD